MQFSVRGVPIHTRSLSIVLRHATADELRFDGVLLDLRKRGFVPVAGDLQASGIIHHMQVEGAVDRQSRTITRITARMPSVAFEPAPITEGESCRDLVGRVDALAGTSLDQGFARQVGGEIGGPRGCSHVLTLIHLLGPTIAWAIAEDARLLGPSPARRPAERVFRRDLVVDGYATDSGALALGLQLSDLHLHPAPPIAPAPDRFAGQVEVRVAAELSIAELRLSSVGIAERRRGPASFEAAQWVDRPDRAEPLVGVSLRAGITEELLRQMPSPGQDQPLLDALLMLAPATVQCFASFPDTWTQTPWSKGAAAETGGYPDSCYMWRRDGALGRRRTNGSA